MWRSFFFAVGTMVVILGVECLMIESATLATEETRTVQVSRGIFSPATKVAQVKSRRTVKPPEWIPWSLITSGAVIILYSLTLPQRNAPSGGQ